MPRLFETQVAAILRAGAHGSIRILLPMLTSVGEMRQARNIIQRTARRLRRQGVAIADPLPPIGAMIETPAAALGADALADHSDFFAIGTNDLTMYTLAIDRSDEQVASLYNPFHPAVLRLIVFAVTAARERGSPSASAARSRAIRVTPPCCWAWACESCRCRPAACPG